MKCPQCEAAINKGQNFCGDCGQQLNIVCSGCSTTNPPSYRFCGQCGQNLADVGTLVLDRSGLILDADDTALDLLIPKNGIAVGKPFSLFVSTGERPLFFSYWNELLCSAHSQTLEVELNPARDGVMYAQLVLSHLSNQEAKSEQIRVEIDDVTTRRQSIQELQEKKDLLDCIGSMIDTFHPLNSGGRRKIIGGVMEKIGFISAGQYAFIARIDEVSKQLFTEFNWHASSRHRENEGVAAIAVDHVRPILDKLQKGQSYVAGDISSLSLAERQIWQTWQHQYAGAVLCEMIYLGKQPVGIIGISKPKACLWPRTTKTLIKLAGNLMAETLSQTPAESSIAQLSPTTVKPSKHEEEDEQVVEIEDFTGVEIIKDEQAEIQADSDRVLPIEIVADAHNGPNGSIPLFSSDDGEYRLTCSKCNRQESVSMSLFEENGWILKVTCSCDHTFRVIREMRYTYRKNVQLEGLFAQEVNDVNKLAVSRSWSAIEVTNISKNGLNFTSPSARMLQKGDLVQLKFNLDNSSKSLIEKPAEIKSIRKNNVGCNFKGSDKHDVTLGFYFL